MISCDINYFINIFVLTFCLLLVPVVSRDVNDVCHFVLFSLCTTQEIHGLLRQGVSAVNISSKLSPWASALFEFLPPFIKKQVLICYVSSH